VEGGGGDALQMNRIRSSIENLRLNE